MVYNNLGCGFTLGCKIKETTKASDPIDLGASFWTQGVYIEVVQVQELEMEVALMWFQFPTKSWHSSRNNNNNTLVGETNIQAWVQF